MTDVLTVAKASSYAIISDRRLGVIFIQEPQMPLCLNMPSSLLINDAVNILLAVLFPGGNRKGVRVRVVMLQSIPVQHHNLSLFIGQWRSGMLTGGHKQYISAVMSVGNCSGSFISSDIAAEEKKPTRMPLWARPSEAKQVFFWAGGSKYSGLVVL